MTETLNLKGLQATLHAHWLVLQALALSHPDRDRFKRELETLVSGVISRTEDPEISGVLASFEELFRTMLAAPPPGDPPQP